MRLGVDVDGVVLDTIPLYNAALQNRGCILNPEKTNAWDLEEMYGVSSETVQEAIKEVEQITDVPLIPGAQILNKIVELPHIESPIQFVSSRGLGSFYPTIEALQHHFDFPIHLRCEIGREEYSKGQYCDAWDLDFFIEDGPPHIREIFCSSDTKIYILDKPYNQETKVFERTSCLRVTNWDEIFVDLVREGYREAVRVKC